MAPSRWLKDAVKLLFRHFMRRSERIDAGVVDENIDMATSKFDRSLCHLASAGCVAKIGGNEISPSSTRVNSSSALHIAPHHENVNTKLSEFFGYRETDSARSTRNKRCRTIAGHLEIPHGQEGLNRRVRHCDHRRRLTAGLAQGS